MNNRNSKADISPATDSSPSNSRGVPCVGKKAGSPVPPFTIVIIDDINGPEPDNGPELRRKVMEWWEKVRPEMEKEFPTMSIEYGRGNHETEEDVLELLDKYFGGRKKFTFINRTPDNHAAVLRSLSGSVIMEGDSNKEIVKRLRHCATTTGRLPVVEEGFGL
jgi:hypothetical protein